MGPLQWGWTHSPGGHRGKTGGFGVDLHLRNEKYFNIRKVSPTEHFSLLGVVLNKYHRGRVTWTETFISYNSGNWTSRIKVSMGLLSTPPPNSLCLCVVVFLRVPVSCSPLPVCVSLSAHQSVYWLTDSKMSQCQVPGHCLHACISSSWTGRKGSCGCWGAESSFPSFLTNPLSNRHIRCCSYMGLSLILVFEWGSLCLIPSS